MTIPGIIIDDDPSCTILIEELLKTYCPQVETIAKCATIKDAVAKINQLKPSVVFLDIELNGEIGFDLFKYFPSPTFQVIFTTSHQEYALRAIKASCLDFILKPVDPAELVEAVGKLNNQNSINKNIPALIDNVVSNSQTLNRITISTQKDFIFIDVENIVCLEGDGKYTTFYTSQNEKIISSENLGEYEKILNKTPFFRCHKSWIINLKYIKKFIKEEDTVIMTNGTKIPIAHRRRDDFFKMTL